MVDANRDDLVLGVLGSVLGAPWVGSASLHLHGAWATPRCVGPLAWGDSIGARTILVILDELHGFYRDPRYRPSPWLIRRARLGVSLLTPEA